MRLRRYFPRAHCSEAQIALILSTLALFVVAFLPTLYVDYVPQDQWRAFRYSLADQGATTRFHACANMLPPFYIATGRPLLWLGECVEHAWVARIADFRPLRVVCMILVVVTLVLLARALLGLWDDPALAVIISAAALYCPGYCFMYYQGLAAAPVLLAAILGICSFIVLSRMNVTAAVQIRQQIPRIALGSAIFILACCLYPVYAFTAVALTLIYAALDRGAAIRARVLRMFALLCIYGGVALVYMVLAKALMYIYFQSAHRPVVPLGEYSFEMSLHAGQLIPKLQALLAYFSDRLAISAYRQCPSVVKYALLAGIVTATSMGSGGQAKWTVVRRIVLTAVMYAAGAVVMVGPWFVSGRALPGDTYTLTIQIAIVVAAGTVASSYLVRRQPKQRDLWRIVRSGDRPATDGVHRPGAAVGH
jgi:hypothetical protein